MAKKIQPKVYQKDNYYYCLLGPNPQIGIFGRGNTANEAISDWVQELRKRLRQPKDDDDLLQYLSDTLDLSVSTSEQKRLL